MVAPRRLATSGVDAVASARTTRMADTAATDLATRADAAAGGIPLVCARHHPGPGRKLQGPGGEGPRRPIVIAMAGPWKVSLAGQDVGLTLVREGYAWWYRDYAADQNLLDRVLYPLAEVQARWGDQGLWRDPDPVPPWTFRRR